MQGMRVVEAYCPTCADVREHRVQPDDPGSCQCTVCGAVEILMHPLE